VNQQTGGHCAPAC